MNKSARIAVLCLLVFGLLLAACDGDVDPTWTLQRGSSYTTVNLIISFPPGDQIGYNLAEAKYNYHTGEYYYEGTGTVYIIDQDDFNIWRRSSYITGLWIRYNSDDDTLDVFIGPQLAQPTDTPTP